MATIEIDRADTDEDSYFIHVVVREETGSASQHDVRLDRQQHLHLAGDSESPEAFVRRCFEFLLEREPKESILSEFDVSVIGRYFPEFEREIRRDA